MEPILIILLIVAALAVALIWVCVMTIVLIVRTVAWSARAPVRAVKALALSRPPTPIAGATQCGNPKCNAPLRGEARFCARCGTGVRDALARQRRPSRCGVSLRARAA
jgi:hypothetical protein